ncbi:transcription factor TFIIIB component B'' [Aricia agestis]|uniref:transcription factor TFIIIB component B'' n=1 Tax=Aricia agestis TaxID=91739 RepID=UPI001C20BFA9|nr:transcription factor TFIIIB component B'' [Aricia agestis]
MSTRRARIKAVTSLPPRRKNADKRDNKTNKPDDTSNSVENKPEDSTNKETSTSQTAEKLDDTSNRDQNAQRSIDIDVIKSPESRPNTVSVIRSNVFVSPQKRSPRRTFATPVAPSPKIQKVPDHKSVIQRTGSTPVTQKINDCDELQISNSLINKVNYNEDSQKKDGEPTATLSAAEEAVMDGIMPLQPESQAAKTIDLLKNDINENADVLFDPIIPLPSPGKVRPKLKPVPRLGPHRRNSIQGSASESEDESRRGLTNATPSTPGPRQRYDSHSSIATLPTLPSRCTTLSNRARNDSVCSITSQVAAQVVSSPVKEKQSAKTRRHEANRRMMASKRRRDMMKREAMTMYDLIFYNPSTNPIVPDEDEVKAIEDEKEMNKKAEAEELKKAEEPEDATPVPQLKLGPNGEITLDESSLLINRTSRTATAGVVVEGGWRAGAGGRYRRGPRSAEWPPAETVRFYRALGALGTDFTLMAPLFPDRTRKEIYLKFKKEERLNGAQVDKALRSAGGWDVLRLRDEFSAERAAAREAARRERDRVHAERQAERARLQDARSLRVRTSKASKAMESTMLPGVSQQSEIVTANDIVESVKIAKKRTAETNKTDIAMGPKKPKATPITLESPNLRTEATPITSESPNLRTEILSPDKIANLSNQVPKALSNIESGSLVVLTVDDPSTPGKKMLQTYIAHGPHKLTPVALPSTLLNSVVGYMKKKSTNINTSSNPSSPLLSPGSVNSDRPSAFQSPVQRTRHTSFTIQPL